MTRLVENVEANIVHRGLLPDGQSALVAVSGGVDSMVLLYVLNSLAGRHEWKLTIAHFNHRLRGSESDADERLVRKSANQLKLPLVVEKWTDGDRKQSIKSHGLEMAARLARHAFWNRLATSLGIGTLATGHHADDQVELFFIRLFRGSGTDGLGGMNWSTEGVLEGARIIRPLLDQSKATLAEFARGRNIPFREDASNRNTDFARNRIRRKLLPRLAAEYEPAIVKTISRSMEIIATESDFVRREAARWLLPGKHAGFDRLHPAIQRQCLRLQLMRMSIVADFQAVEQLRLNPERPATVARGIVISRDLNGRVHRMKTPAGGFNPAEAAIEIGSVSGSVNFDGVALKWKRMPVSKAGPVAQSRICREYYDLAKLGDRIILRHWRKGDRFQPIGMARPVKLQDLFTNLRIPREERRSLVLATCGEGEVFWVEGLRISERFKVSSRTRALLRWEWSRKWGIQPEIANEGAP